MTTAAGLPAWSGRYAQRMTRLCLEEWGDTCHLCTRPGATTADHLIPRSLGGLDTLENLRPAHHRCNSRRQARPLTPLLLAEFRATPAAPVDRRSTFVGW